MLSLVIDTILEQEEIGPPRLILERTLSGLKENGITYNASHQAEGKKHTVR
jgi:hypothetical protein